MLGFGLGFRVKVTIAVKVKLGFRAKVIFMVMLVFRAKVVFLPVPSIYPTNIKETFNNLNRDSGQFLEIF